MAELEARAPVEVTQADIALVEAVVDAANIVSHDGYYEVDVHRAAEAVARHRIAAEQATPPEGVQAAGFKLVPVEPTEAMIEAGAEAVGDIIDDGYIGDARKFLSAAIAASPDPQPAGSATSAGEGWQTVFMVTVDSEHDRHTFTFAQRAEFDTFMARYRETPGIDVTAIEERHVATAEYALGGLPEMLEAQDD